MKAKIGISINVCNFHSMNMGNTNNIESGEKISGEPDESDASITPVIIAVARIKSGIRLTKI
jgi:hypothetical protein